ncbi:PAS domain-containing hybrid sensor histidine kinase/response regulator [Geomobilimonas luticola]|uniref:histidine kinase n=1 Tax=Geomobilimonas luticola TaxID=1114878 RepID=A0ABS5SJH9_9BACT|nr:PAS domain S-box protein [Geomobilimonas luticola]MBT0654597.1 PAS domain S-box protein [Geomobilimonas luticola]
MPIPSRFHLDPYALRIAAMYFLLSCGWIFFTDFLVLTVPFMNQSLLLAGILKGCFFVTVTSSLLYWLIRRALTQQEESNRLLAENEERLRLALTASNQGMYDLDLQSGRATVNDAYYQMLGYDSAMNRKADVADWTARLHPDDREKALEVFRACTEGETARYKMEYRLRTAGNGWKWILSVGSVVGWDSGGRPVRMLGTHLDIDDRKQADLALTASEQRYRSLFANMQEGVAYCRMLFDGDNTPSDFVYLEVNEAFTRLTGLEHVVGRKVTEVLPGIKELDPELLGIYGRIALTGQPEKFEIYIMALARWFSVSVYSPEQGCFVAVFDNITARKESEAALQKEKSFTESALNNLNDFFFVFDLEGKFLRWNKALSTVSGYGDDEIRAMKPTDFFPQELRHIVQNAIETAVREGSVFLETTLLTKDGREIPYEFTAGLFKDLNGVTIGISGTGRDISERREAERERDELTAQLRQAQKIEAIGTLTGGLAHDFNNILTVINGYAALLLRKVPDMKTREILDHIAEAGNRAADMTQQLLAFSRRQVLEPKVIKPEEAILRAEKLLRRLLPESIRITLACRDRGGKVKVDPGQLEQVLINLVINARDAMPTGGEITLATQTVRIDSRFAHSHPGAQPGNYAMITIDDTGEGMPPEVMERVFEPFFTTKAAGKGTGLGLSMVYGIIKQSGGYITVESTVGAGTTFSLYLPLVEEDLHPDEERQEEQPQPPSQTNATVLVVEDEESIRSFIREILDESGCNVLLAASPEEALRVMETTLHPPLDLLITDMVMPGMNGSQLAHILRERQPDLRVLFMSGYTDVDLARELHLSEQTVFLTKPFLPATFMEKVTELLLPGGAQR